jgi:hypothetical protein
MAVATHFHTGMFTVLKNLSNLMTIAGDYFVYGNSYSWQVRPVKQSLIHTALPVDR